MQRYVYAAAAAAVAAAAVAVDQKPVSEVCADSRPCTQLLPMTG